MPILIAIVSILVISAAARLINKALPFAICPVCAGVSGTVILTGAMMLAGWLEFSEFSHALAILTGGAVAGIAFMGERKLVWAEANPMVWKISVIIPGFLLAYFAVLNLSWAVLTAEGLALSAVAYVYFVRRRPGLGMPDKKSADPEKIRTLEEKLKNCC